MREWHDIYNKVQSEVREELIDYIDNYNSDENLFEIVDDLVDEHVSFNVMTIDDVMDIISEETNVFNDEKIKDFVVNQIYNTEFAEVLTEDKYEEDDKYTYYINTVREFKQEEEPDYEYLTNKYIANLSALLYEYDQDTEEIQNVSNASLQEFEGYIAEAVKGNLEKEFSIDENFTVGDFLNEMDKNKTLDERIAEVKIDDNKDDKQVERDIEER